MTNDAMKEREAVATTKVTVRDVNAGGYTPVILTITADVALRQGNDIIMIRRSHARSLMRALAEHLKEGR